MMILFLYWILLAGIETVFFKIITLFYLNQHICNYKMNVNLCLQNRLMQVGEEFCGSKSEVLQESIRKQSVNYFKSYHR